ncbi:nodulation protein NfeD [Ramlibacter sp. 2FC]|uniref:NfeD family protein n=1 Tax=Ramlibacter sp. 2FC TaxID=2502188 RepID=UPI0010F67274|nr:nodulation protein NfeD [Ramlibacter sp. 2FC]
MSPMRKFWIVAAALLLLALPTSLAGTASVPVLQVQDAIGPASADYLLRGLRRAAQEGAPLVIVELDTPGGLDSSMRQMVQAILASPVPVAVHVRPAGARAASAGTYILYAAHVAAMAPATTLGAATPVAIGLPGTERKPPGAPGGGQGDAKQGKDKAPAPPADAMTAKQVHDAAAFIRGLAQLRGRNAEWAERAVREAVSLTAEEALRERVIDLLARDPAELLARLDGRSLRTAGGELKLATRGLTLETRPPDWRHRLLSVVSQPSIALLLMMLGIYALLFEFSSPGLGLAGVFGAISLLLGLFALQLLPVNYAGLALILLGMGLFVAELLAPSFGVLGVGGIAAFVAGGLLLFDTELPGFGVPLPLIVGLALLSAAVVLLGGGLALKAHRRPVVSGHAALIGAPGRVLHVADGDSWAEVQGERWRVSCREPLQPGQAVRVVGVRGLTLDVQAEPEATRQGASS